MSLINQMLQDLDARTVSGDEGADLYAKPVARNQGRPSLPVLIGAAAGVIAIGVAGALGWRYFHKPAPVQTPAALRPVKVVMVPPPPPVAMTVASAPQAAPEPVPAASEPIVKPAAAAPPTPKATARTDRRDAPSAKPASTTRKEKREKSERLAAEKKARAAERKAARATPAKVAALAVPATKTRLAATGATQGREENAGQKAEAAYRNALARLQEGWVSDAIAALEQALQINPRHDAARQTLVGLLIENKRVEDAIRHLQAGLALDARQPAMAMLLARLQIERGGSGIETLTRSLPYAGGNGEYQAFLAGALQRQQRHREAAEQYQAALRSAPHNGVWWMGLGISLQAEKRDADALEAFRKAKASGTLTSELLAFVERKIQSLAR